MVSQATAFREFSKRALSVSLLCESIYCEAKVSNKQLLGEVETPILLEGKRLHEQDAQKALRKFGPTKKAKVNTLYDAMLVSHANVAMALKRRKILANSEKKKLCMCIIPEHGIVGIPDFVDCKNGKWPIIIETKNTKRLPSSPWMEHQIQVVAYSIGLEILGFAPPYGILNYVTRDKTKSKCTYKVPIDDEIKQRTLAISRNVFSILHGHDPTPTTNINKCIPCAYASQCKWSPLRYPDARSF